MSKSSEKKAAAQAALKEAQTKAAEAAAAAAAADANDEHKKAAEAAAAAETAAAEAAAAAAGQDDDDDDKPKPHVMTEEDWAKGTALIKAGSFTIETIVSQVSEGCQMDPIEVRKEFDRRLNIPDAPAASEPAPVAEQQAEEKILCQVPASFKVMINAGHTIDVPAGTNWLPREVAEHWYSKHNGLVIVPPQSPN